MGYLTSFGKTVAQFSLRQQFYQMFLGQMLLTASFVPAEQVLAGSASAPLAVTVTVIRSCNVSTQRALVGQERAASAHTATEITATPIVTIACPNGFDPAIAVSSGIYAIGLRLSTKHPPTMPDTHGNRLGIPPVRSREQRVISLYEQITDREKESKGSYTQNMIITVNF